MRRIVLSVAAALALALLAYSGFWYFAARRLEAALPGWAAGERAKGYDLQWRTAEIGGFPFSLSLRLDDAAIEGERPVAYKIAADPLVVRAKPWNWRRWQVSAPQGARLTVPGAGLDAQHLDGTAEDRADARSASLHLSGIEGTGLAAGMSAAALDANLTIPGPSPQTDRDVLASASAKITGASMPEVPIVWHNFDVLSIGLTMRGAMPAGPAESALAAWRDGGGTLDLATLHFARDNATADATGTLALDDTLQPEGAFSVAVTGVPKEFRALADTGVFKNMGVVTTPDQPGTLHFPITIQDRRIYVGPAQIGVMPYLVWSEARPG